MTPRGGVLAGDGSPGEISPDLPNIGHEHLFGACSLVAWRPQYGRWVHGGEHRRRQFRFDRKAALLHNAECSPEQCLRRGGAEADDHTRLDDRDLVLQPWETGADLGGIGRLVNPPRGARIFGPLEVLDGVRDVHVVTRDSCLVEGTIEQLARRADERPARAVFHVARLLADDHHACGARSLPEDRLRADLEQIAALTAFRRDAKLGERRARWNEISGGAGWLHHAARGSKGGAKGPSGLA